MIKALVCRLLGHKYAFKKAEGLTTTLECVRCGYTYEHELNVEDFFE